MQDLLVMNTTEPIYNLAMGTVDTIDENFQGVDMVQGRRTIKSLLLPFAMVDVPESINLFPPKLGRNLILILFMIISSREVFILLMKMQGGWLESFFHLKK